MSQCVHIQKEGMTKMNVNFFSKKDASDLLARNDVFIDALSPFDRSSRLKTSSEVSQKQFLEFASKQAKDWTEDEMKIITEIVSGIDNKFNSYSLQLPREIPLIKTTGLEEGNAAYCRRNAIVIPETILFHQDQLEDLLIHESFHVFSKNNLKIREKLYKIIGFTSCPELNFPRELLNQKITNPDAPLNNFYTELLTNNGFINVIPVLFSDEPYNTDRGGEFFDYMQFKLLSVKIEDECCTPVYNGDQLALHGPNEVPDYFQKIGRNTEYIIHPEEVIAENFTMMINKRFNVPNPGIIKKMNQILENKK